MSDKTTMRESPGALGGVVRSATSRHSVSGHEGTTTANRVHRRKRRTWAAFAIGCIAVLGPLAVIVFIGVGKGTGGTGPSASATSSNEMQVETITNPSSGIQNCIRVTVDGTSQDGCITAPAVSVWRISGTDYLVARGSLELDDGRMLSATSPSDYVVVPFSDYAPRVHLGSCMTPGLVNAVAAQLGTDGPPYIISGCTPYYAFVSTEVPGSDVGDTAMVFERADETWQKLSTVDFANPDRETRCAILPTERPEWWAMSAREFCLMGG